MYKPLTVAEEQAAHSIIGCGIDVHRVLGRGFKEIIYERAMRLELSARGLRFECEKEILVKYKTGRFLVSESI